ncbi:MAG: hypothetical protein IPM34_03015 [Saprospiraceae bacterium]|nr:hypothetical protein [Saprospiraceae bacterium]
MGTFKTYHYSSGKSYWERLLGSVLFLGLIALMFYLFFQLYVMLWYIVPLLILALLIFDRKVFWAHFKSIGDQISNNILAGLAGALVNLLGLPFVLIGLLLKSWIFKKFGKLSQEHNSALSNDAYTSYEEVESQPNKSNPNRLRKAETDHRYDDLFE